MDDIANRMKCYRKTVAGLGGPVARWQKKKLLWWAETGLIGALRVAASRWSAVCALDLVETQDATQADIVCSFGSIDGENGTLAYAYFPPVPGRKPQPIHGDMIVEPVDFQRQNLDGCIEIVTHELGHSIGIDHHEGAEHKHALMAPYYSGSRGGKLYAEDIAEAQKLYPLPK